MSSLCSVSRSGMVTARPLLAMVTRPATLSLVRGNVGRPTAVVSSSTATTLRLEFLRTKTYHPRGISKKKLDEMQTLVNAGPKNFGEKIYLWNHIQANYVLWSTTKELRSNKALRQVQFTGKKNTLLKIRKDYWRPMATVQFPLGEGEVGLSVYQKLVELKKRHELEWDDGGEEAQRLLNLTKVLRGRELNDQKGNSVADLAFVLGGGGKGNKVVKNHEEIKKWRVRMLKMEEEQGEKRQEEELDEEERKRKEREEVVNEEVRGEGVEAKEQVKEVEAKEEGKEEEAKEEKEEEEDEVEESRPLGEEPAKELHKVRVFWANELDHHFAESWPDNVEHVLGLPKEDWTLQDLDKLIANQERLVELHADLRAKKLAEREKKADKKARFAAKKAGEEQRFAPTPEGEIGWKSRPRAPKPFTGKAPKWAKEGL
ncbi:transcriptional regulation of mitochondrial recombination-domain-containing protein [Triangularia setosa]|uniref:Large ribosomal subunit protein mL67 n=1 Tax=Triangularia setosa TaxID=2587417 RepID=A0AAN6W6K2_9PEZI|nr:transcriptional regulation of mitochondrial recombination-domain-containing protein [Podospora setosa]